MNTIEEALSLFLPLRLIKEAVARATGETVANNVAVRKELEQNQIWIDEAIAEIYAAEAELKAISDRITEHNDMLESLESTPHNSTQQ